MVRPRGLYYVMGTLVMGTLVGMGTLGGETPDRRHKSTGLNRLDFLNTMGVGPDHESCRPPRLTKGRHSQLQCSGRVGCNDTNNRNAKSCLHGLQSECGHMGSTLFVPHKVKQGLPSGARTRCPGPELAKVRALQLRNTLHGEPRVQFRRPGRVRQKEAGPSPGVHIVHEGVHVLGAGSPAGQHPRGRTANCALNVKGLARLTHSTRGTTTKQKPESWPSAGDVKCGNKHNSQHMSHIRKWCSELRL